MTDVARTPGELAVLFADIERQLSVLASDADATAAVTRLAVLAVPGVEFAGITRSTSGGEFRTVAPTDEIVGRVDKIQYELRSGPCIDAIIDDTIYNAGQLAADARWPTFGARASAEQGIASMLAFRLFMESEPTIVAALNLYSSQPDAFTAESETVGLLLATHGALALAAATARETAANLTVALKTSRQIGTAIGILMALQKVTQDQAFNLLRISSQHVNRKLSDVALEVVETGSLPERRR